MAMGSLDRGSVNLIPGQLRMHESQEMPIFRMTSWELKKHRFDAGKNGLRLAIVMKRKITTQTDQKLKTTNHKTSIDLF